MRIRNNKNRRGLTLIFVVSMIVLFLLMGTTFVIISNDYFKSARKRGQAKIYTVDRTALVHRFFYTVVRGPDLSNPNSPFRGHDLLSDQYGFGFKAYINGVDTGASEAPIPVGGSGDQFFQVTLRSASGAAGSANMVWELHKPDATNASALTNVAGIYNGLVFSFVSGPAKGVSSRIVDHRFDSVSGNHYFWIVPTWLDTGSVAPAALVDSEVVINGRDFTGPGAGGANSGGSGELGSGALLPNRIGEPLSDFLTNYFDDDGTWPNETYDAADFQNMFLSGRDNDGNIIPSMHRKSLYDYQYLNHPDQTPYGIRKYSFRPIFLDEVNNGSGALTPDGIPDEGSTANANFPYNRHVKDSATTSARADLEIDTDMDGENDSVLIDPGYGIITDRNGKRFKPLVACRIVDLDGRLNVNAQGNLTQIPSASNYIRSSVPLLGNSPSLPRGSGYGPAEVSLLGLFNNNGNAYESLLWTRYQPSDPNLPFETVPGDGGLGGKSLSKLFGHPVNTVDWANNRFGTVDRDSANFPETLFASSAMNIHGRFAIATPLEAVVFDSSSNAYSDFRDRNVWAVSNGLPVIDMAESANTLYEFANNPYEMSIAQLPFGDRNDSPFDALDLERVMRQFDIDSTLLSDRLWNAPNGFSWSANPVKRELVTTDSFEVPMIHENFKAIIINVLREAPHGLTLDQAIIRADEMVAAGMFAPELLRGLKMDVNRPLGNGYDDNNDGVVDNPGEADFEQNRDFDPANSAVLMDLNNDFARGSGENNARELLARHLYMLALLVTDPIDVDLDGDGNPDADSYERVIAQWAVNVVDFRDPDSIMTRFQFDVDPWNGVWDDFATNGTPLNDANTVWGCERPELLITETVAAHPRRSEDLGSDPSGDDVADGDEDFDQGLRPEPFAFIELYNPWTQNSLNQRLDSSLYDASTQGVQLDRVSSGTNPSPVWRLSIDRPDRGGVATDARPMRYVYFTDPDVNADAIDDDDGANVEVFFSSWTPATLRPGAQAVVGSLGFEDSNNAGQYRSFMGRRTGKTQGDEAANNLELDTTQHIRIDPSAGEVYRYPVDATNDPRYSVILPIDKARIGTKNSPTEDRDFSISDPFGGYTTLDASGLPYVQIPDGDGYRYTVPHDVPLDHSTKTDSNRNDEDMTDILVRDGMSQNFRTVRLQRLANPLMPWHETDNPYLTIDLMEMDLIAFNGVNGPRKVDNNVVGPARKPDSAESLERGVEGIGQSGAESKHRELWRSARGTIASGTPITDQYFEFRLTESLGKTNDAFTNPQALADGNGFPWLTWNNRPYVSHLELTNVPFAEPQWLTRNFTTNDGTDPYSGANNTIRGRFRHLLNFFANDEDSGGTRAKLYRLMDYLEVPSRFLGSEQRMNPAIFTNNPFNVLSRYRVPGKINLNTIYADPNNATRSTIWEALQGNYAQITGGCSWDDFRKSRKHSSGIPTDFGNPFRPAGEGQNVPPGVPEISGPGCTLFRNDFATNGANGNPLFDFDNTNRAFNSERSAYFRNAQRQRLGNLVTTKSSVFAIWITVAYFEVDERGLVGAEVGSDTGEVTRNRGFYIFDRSIPMAFEPGKNHNVERGILVQSIIE